MATEKLQLYKCEVCGNLVQVILSGAGELVCCGQPMKLQSIQHDKSETGEKHAPIVEFRENDRFVQVKSHPMLPEHYIQWIYVQTNLGGMKKYLNPNEEPTASFKLAEGESVVAVYEYCNLHGLWKTTL